MKIEQKWENNQIKRVEKQHKKLPRMAIFGEANK